MNGIGDYCSDLQFCMNNSQRAPTLRAFWDLEKTLLHETRVSGTVIWSPTNSNSPTYMYISVLVETVLVVFV